jgi:hypothetical protein
VPAGSFQDRRSRLDELLASSTAVLSARFLDGVRRLREDRRIRRLAREGRLVEILAEYRIVAEDVANALQEQILRAGGDGVTEIATQLGVRASLDPARFRVAPALRSQRDRLLADLLTVQTRSINAAARSGDPALIVASLGMSERQLAALVRYRDLLARGAREAARRELADRELEAELDRALEADEPPDEDQQAVMVAAYGGTLLAAGAALLAGAEAQVALGQGMDLALAQAGEDDLIAPETLTGTWRTRRDEKVRSSHRAMHGQVRPIGQPFRSGDGNLLRYPGDENAPASDRVRCRCVVISRAGVPARVGVA